LIELKVQYKDDKDKLNLEGMYECSFLNTYYYDIYNKIIKDEINLEILYNLLDTLKEIEEGSVNQYQASVKVGTLLKTIYIDSALRKSEKLNSNEKEPLFNNGLNMKWSDYKKQFKTKL
jgi:hypothetical protein